MLFSKKELLLFLLYAASRPLAAEMELPPRRPTLDRQIVYPGSIPLDTDILNIERSVMVAIGYLAQATLGTSIVADGLACGPTQPASMTVSVGPGSITQWSVVDTIGFGSLAADSTQPLVKIGVNLAPTNFLLAAPAGPGEAINYVIEASFLEEDTTPVILPYYNAASPGSPYSGPNNSGAPQNTQRLQRVQFQVKAGAPGVVGSQQTPSVDAGWAGLYVVTVNTGETSVLASNIVTLPTAPFLPWKLPQLSPGTSRMAVLTPASQGSWIVPAGVSNVRVRIWGGGGAGGPGFGGAGGGGAGGGYAESFCNVTPGQGIVVTIGNGGVGAGTNGGNSSFGDWVAATGGLAGSGGGNGIGGSGGASGGVGSGPCFNCGGQAGGAALQAGSDWSSGRGGAAYGGAGAEAVVSAATVNADGHAALLPGCGGAGGVGGGLGGQGGPGAVILEW